MRKDKLNLYAMRSDQFWIGMSTFLKAKHFSVTTYINLFMVDYFSFSSRFFKEDFKWQKHCVKYFTHDFDQGFTVQATKMFF